MLRNDEIDVYSEGKKHKIFRIIFYFKGRSYMVVIPNKYKRHESFDLCEMVGPFLEIKPIEQGT